MSKDLLGHMVVLVQMTSAIQRKDRMHDQGLDMLSKYDLDAVYLLAFAVKQMLAVVEFGYHFLPVVLEY